MKIPLKVTIVILSVTLLSCFGSKKSLKLGNCPLTVTVKAEGENFDGYANVYINEKFVGTTDSKTQVLKISLERGEYILWVTAEGYEPWKGKILLLGDGYKQNVLARLNKSAGSKKKTVGAK